MRFRVHPVEFAKKNIVYNEIVMHKVKKFKTENG